METRTLEGYQSALRNAFESADVSRVDHVVVLTDANEYKVVNSIDWLRYAGGQLLTVYNVSTESWSLTDEGRAEIRSCFGLYR